MTDQCKVCGSEHVDAHYNGAPYCSACLRPLLFGEQRTPDSFVLMAEKLAQLAIDIPGKVTGSLRRAVDASNKMIETISEVAETLPTPDQWLDQWLSAHKARTPAGDECLAQDLQSMLDDGDYGLEYWLPDCDCSALVHYCLDHPDLSVAGLLAHTREHGRIFDGVNSVLFGTDLEMRQLLLPPWEPRLAQVSARAFALGLNRMVELARVLRDGRPPDDSFQERERQLYLAIESISVRRTARTWHRLAELAGEGERYNDRAERMIQLWLLHPGSGLLREYLRLVYRCYTSGFDAEAIIVCRAVLERGVRDILDQKNAAAPDAMGKRIEYLRGRGWLSEDGARRARAVWARGNKVVHEDPNLISDAYDTIRDCIAVLDELLAPAAG